MAKHGPAWHLCWRSGPRRPSLHPASSARLLPQTLKPCRAQVFIHMISAYQVYSQPVFASVEPLLRRSFPASVGRMSPRALSLVFRSLYVCATTLVSCMM